MRCTFQPECIRHKSYPHRTAYTSDIIRNQPCHIDSAFTNVFGEIRDRVEKLSYMNRQAQCRAKCDESVHVGGADGIFKPRIIQLVKQTADLHRFVAVVYLDGVVRQHELISGRLTYL